MEYEKKETFRMPNLLTIFADPKVAAIPMNALNTLKLPIIDGFRPEGNSIS